MRHISEWLERGASFAAAAGAKAAAPAVDICDDATPAPTPSTVEAIGTATPADATAPEGSAEWAGLLERHALPMASLNPAALSALGPLHDAVQTFEAEGRPALLAKLKEAGLTVLPVRQKVANAISKEARLRSVHS